MYSIIVISDYELIMQKASDFSLMFYHLQIISTVTSLVNG